MLRVICGGLKLIINAASPHRDICNEVFDAVGEIPGVTRAATFSFTEYRFDELNVRIATMYKEGALCLQEIQNFYKERAPGRTRSKALNVIRAVSKGPNYGKQIELEPRRFPILLALPRKNHIVASIVEWGI